MITQDNRSSKVLRVQPNSRVRPFLGLGVHRPPPTVRTDDAFRVSFSAILGEEPEVEVGPL
jgi:hypothetical protein